MKTTSKIFLSFLSLAWIMSGACAASMENGGAPYLTKDFTVNGPGNLQVQTSGGSISVTAHAGNKVKVEMYVRKEGEWMNAGDEEATELLENYTIDISQSGSTVKAIAERESSLGGWFNGNNTSISFTVYVPEEMSTSLKTSGGSIALDGVRGQQEVNTSGGSLELKNIEGKMNAHTSGGSIHIESYAGNLNAHTSGGSIHLQDSKGDLKVHTSGGGIRINNVEGSIDASTSGGGIDARLLALTKYMKLHTSGGSINAVIPGGLGLDLDLKGNHVNTKLHNFSGEAEKDRIRGSMNGGGIPVVISTSGGSVNLKYQ